MAGRNLAAGADADPLQHSLVDVEHLGERLSDRRSGSALATAAECRVWHPVAEAVALPVAVADREALAVVAAERARDAIHLVPLAYHVSWPIVGGVGHDRGDHGLARVADAGVAEDLAEFLIEERVENAEIGGYWTLGRWYGCGTLHAWCRDQFGYTEAPVSFGHRTNGASYGVRRVYPA